jgi:hypothetical protein
MSDATTTTKANPWKANRRALKAQRLIEVLDAAFDLARITLPEARLDSVSSMNDAAWACAAACAGVNLPSLETREIVLDTFRRRVRASVDCQIAAAVASALKAVG